MSEATISTEHLGFIQDAITRMGQNSFQAKGWCITVVSALMALLISQEKCGIQEISGYVLCATTVFFCLLDTYYLYLERGYRYLYNAVTGFAPDCSESIAPYQMQIPKSQRSFKKYMKALLSVTTGLFYLAIIVLVVVAVYYISCNGVSACGGE